MFSQVVVLGAGQMGSGIAQVIAQKNIPVQLVDLSEEVLKTAQEKIKNSLNKLYQKKLIILNPNEVLQNIQFSSELNIIKNSELVIEAVPENKALKLKVFKQVSNIVSSDTIIASNTSSISLTQLAETLPNPERVAGLHFMNPVPLMKLVEIIRAKQTKGSVFKKLCEFTVFLDKEFVCSLDRPGFIVNRILMPMINEAVFVLKEGTSSAEDIDKAMRLGCHYPMGPLALADLIGLDTCLSIMEVLQEGLGDKYTPCSLLKKYVKEGRLGKKTGKGFYVY